MQLVKRTDEVTKHGEGNQTIPLTGDYTIINQREDGTYVLQIQIQNLESEEQARALASVVWGWFD